MPPVVTVVFEPFALTTMVVPSTSSSVVSIEVVAQASELWQDHLAGTELSPVIFYQGQWRTWGFFVPLCEPTFVEASTSTRVISIYGQ